MRLPWGLMHVKWSRSPPNEVIWSPDPTSWPYAFCLISQSSEKIKLSFFRVNGIWNAKHTVMQFELKVAIGQRRPKESCWWSESQSVNCRWAETVKLHYCKICAAQTLNTNLIRVIQILPIDLTSSPNYTVLVHLQFQLTGGIKW